MVTESRAIILWVRAYCIYIAPFGDHLFVSNSSLHFLHVLLPYQFYILLVQDSKGSFFQLGGTSCGWKVCTVLLLVLSPCSFVKSLDLIIKLKHVDVERQKYS